MPQVDIERFLGHKVTTPFLNTQIRVPGATRAAGADFFPDDPLRGGFTSQKMGDFDPHFQTTGAIAARRFK